MNFWRNAKGAVSIFLTIILVPMMTVSALFVDAGKVKLARGVAESAGDLTLNTALTDYDAMLKDMYGLFATSQNTDELFVKLEDYYRTCITSSGISDEDADSYVDQIMAQLGRVSEEDTTTDILNMELIDFDVSKKDDAALNNPTILKRQIVDFMKYRAPVNTGLGFLSSLSNFTTLGKQTELVDKRQSYYQEQSTVMENARKAWSYINQYNKSGFVISDRYFSDMKNHFDGYENDFETIAVKIIKDLYDTQNYSDFTEYPYSIEYEEIEIDDDIKEEIPIFYTNKAKTSKKKNFTQYKTYSDTSPASAKAIKSALSAYHTAAADVEAARSQMKDYDSNTYGLQYLVQTNREGLYQDWAESMAVLYDRYSALRHAVDYAGKTEDEVSVMKTEEKLFGESSAHPYSYYYNQFLDHFDLIAADFQREFPQYSQTLQKYAEKADTSTSGIEQKITDLYTQITGYRTTISEAKSNLDEAVSYLNRVYEGVKADGTLEKKEQEWQQIAGDSDLADTSTAKQDLAEIKNLSDYLKPEDVASLIQRLENISGHLQQLLNQIDSYTFFGTKISEISDYNTLVYLLKSQIGDDNLKNVPLDKTELNQQASDWVNGKFHVGNAVDVSWENQSKTQPNLIQDKENFYVYLYQHFNEGDVSVSTEEKQEDYANGKDLYNQIKDSASTETKNRVESGSTENSGSSHELADLKGRPSDGFEQNQETAHAEVVTDESAVHDTGESLGSMFANLSSAIIDMGTDLRDKLYVSDYILSMFSYDTLEKECQIESSNKNAVPKSLTVVPITAENHFAYGREVEYIIYGGSNSSNLTKAYGSIYGIRLGFNLIYAFSDSVIRDTAFALASPISAATLGVLPAPLVQAAIIIGIACCESAIDLNDLREGKSVPLLKDKTTWKMQVKELIKKASEVIGDGLKEVANNAVDQASVEINELLDKTDAELTEYIENSSDKVIAAVTNSYDTMITRHAESVIQKLTTLCNNAIEEKMLDSSINMEEMVSRELNAWLEEEAKKVDTSSDISYKVKCEAVKLIEENHFISEMLTVLGNKGKEGIAEAANEITQVIERIRKRIQRQLTTVSEEFIGYKDQVKEEIQNSLDEGADSLKELLSSKIDGVFGSGSKSAANGNSLSSLISFSYSDYLRLFLMIGLYTNEEGVLLRTGDAIQANMGLVTGNDGYKLSNSATYVEISATVQVPPTLLALPLFADVEGNPSTNQKWYTFEYQSTKGY